MRISRSTFLLVFLCISQPCIAAVTVGEGIHLKTTASTVPDRDIQYKDNKRLPRWKLEWDQARALYRQGKTGQALVQYELLLQQKSTLDEARWEYAGLLIQKKRWKQAGIELDTLLAHDPDNREYLLARAGVSLKQGHAERAVKQFGQLYEGSPSGDDALEALTGLIAALDLLGNLEAQLPLLEQLLLRKPGDLSLLKRTGEIALELGQPEKTIRVLGKSLEEHPDDADLLRLAAGAEEMLGNREQAAACRQRLVSVKPDDVQAHQWLALYAQEKGDYAKALHHVEFLLKRDPGNVDLLLRAAHLQEGIGQPGRALDSLSLYLDIVPGDKKVFKERTRIRKMLATDLETLVENRKARQLWKDLSRITGDREGVFRQMADRLRQQGKQVELTDVLLVLYQQHPDDLQLYNELVGLMEAQGRYYEIEKL